MTPTKDGIPFKMVPPALPHSQYADTLKYTPMFPFDVADDANRFRAGFVCHSTYGQTFELKPKPIVAQPHIFVARPQDSKRSSSVVTPSFEPTNG